MPEQELTGVVCALSAGTLTEGDMREIRLFHEFLRAAKEYGALSAYRRVYGEEHP